MLSHETASRLKEAGYPQKSTWSVTSRSNLYYDKPNSTVDSIADHPEAIKIPLLSELIEACGEDFLFVEKQRGYEDKLSWTSLDYEGVNRTYGQSPEEAVANLYLALNSK